MIINNAVLTGSFTVNGVNYITNTPTTGSNTYVGTQTTSGSAIITGSLQVTGSVSTTGTITAQTLVVQTVTSSIVYSSGSNIFGNQLTNVQQMTGSLRVTGSLSLNDIAIPTSASLASTYLPLAGGTLTGALSGTTADFLTTTASRYLQIRDAGTSTPSLRSVNDTIAQLRAIAIEAHTISLRTGASSGLTVTEALGISATGAATFSSSLTIGAATALNFGARGGITQDGSWNFSWSTNSVANALYLQSSTGNVGIGTSSPSFILSFGGDTARTIGMNQSTLGTAPALTLKGADSTTGTNNEGGAVYISAGLGTGNGATSNIIFSTAPSAGSGATRQTLTERMRITSGGDVGIGRSAPAGKLDVAGTIRTTNTTDPNYYGTFANPDGNTHISSVGGGAMILNVSATERMRIFASGNVRFSSQVYGNTVASPRTLYIASDGELGGISSIRSSKTNINEINCNWLMQLNPISFNYRKKDEDGNYLNEHYEELFYGLIAEETELVNKELCTYNDEKLIGIEYSKLVPVLLKAIQEQQIQIQNLQSQITELKNK